MRQFVQKDRGNALIMGALSFVALAAFGVLTIDIGRIFVTKNQLQNAADAGALAGASLFCEEGTPTDDEINNRVRLIGQAHKALSMDVPAYVDIPNSQITITRDPDDARNIVEVRTQSPTRQYFLNLLTFAAKSGTGGNSADVHAVAAAACGATCGVQCVKPWSIPDRWDDSTPIPGYTASNKTKGGNWQNNNKYDQEDFTDANGNNMWDPGEAFVDGNANGQYDQEQYNSLLTGYIPDPYPGNSLSPNGDLGLELTLKAANGSQPEPGQYWAVDLPPLNRATPITGGDQYRENIANCNTSEVWPGDWLQTESGNMVGQTNQGMRDLIAQDPDAYWDDITQSVQGSKFAISPRIVLIPLHDPRIWIKSGNSTLQVVKVAAFFMEQMDGNAEVRGKFLKVRPPGSPCVAGGAGGGGATSFTYSLSLIR